MAKKTIGSVLKGKEGKPAYIKIKETVTLKKDSFLDLNNKAAKLAQVKYLLENNFIDEATAEKRQVAITNQPDFVMFDIVMNTED